MDNLAFIPPITFTIVLLFVAFQVHTFKKLAAKGKDHPEGKTKAYACGEDYDCKHQVEPEYSQFFPFAFFFTIMHVVAMMVATLPAPGVASEFIDVIYIAGAVIALFILYRR